MKRKKSIKRQKIKKKTKTNRETKMKRKIRKSMVQTDGSKKTGPK